MAREDILRSLRTWKKEGGVLATPIGPVELGRQLGQGGNAVVYEAVRPEEVAVKLLAEDVRGGESERFRRFRAEYLNLVRLVPTGRVVPLYQFGVVDVGEARVPYILMERCTGTLKDQLRGDPVRTEEAFVQLLDDLVTSLEVIHRAGIVHRDLKPENVLVRPNGDRVLADFGISWFDPDRYDRDVETRGGDRLGNFAFSAPEQVRRDYAEPVPSMDYYALGQVLYWAVAGTTVRGTSHAPMRSVVRALGRFDPLIDALVSQDPSARPTTLNEVRALVERPERDPEEERYWAMRRAQDTFDDALSRGLPGSWGPTPIPTEKLDRMLGALASTCEDAGLYLLTKRGESGACPMFKEADMWVIGNYECPVDEAWVYRSPTAERQFVLLRLKELAPFPVRGPGATGDSDEAGYIDGRYVRREEYDDGYAELDGEVVDVRGADLRIRLFGGPVVALAPNLSVPAMGGRRAGGERERERRLRRLGETEEITREDVEGLGRMERPWWMSVYD